MTPQRFLEKLKTYHFEIILFFFFLLLTVILTYPLVFNFRSSIYGYPGDPFGGIWSIWWLKYAWQKGISPSFSPLIAAPFGATLGQVRFLVWDYLLLPLSLLFGEVFAYNFFIFVSFPLSGITMYFLAYYLTKNKLAAVVSGLIYTFSPYHLIRGLTHLTLTNIQWLPLYFLALLKLREERSYRSAIFVGLAFSLVFLFDYYYGYFTVFFTLLFLLFSLGYDLRRSFKFQTVSAKLQNSFFNPNVLVTKSLTSLKLSFVSILAAIFVIIPFFYPVFKNVSSSEPQAFARYFPELFVYSARPWDYLLPSIDNPFFGKYVFGFLSARLHSSNFFEQTLYLGYLPLLLAFFAVMVKSVERKIKIDEERSAFATRFFLLAALGAALFSAPPLIELGRLRVPMISYYAYSLFSMFRVYARFGIFAILSISVLAGIGFKYLFDFARHVRRQVAIFLVVVTLILVEFINVPPFRTTDVSAKAVPQVYEWLASQKGSFIVAEYPVVSYIEFPNYDYLFYQRIHQKRLLNGALPGTRADRMRENLFDITNPGVPSLLRYLGVKYVIIHGDKYREGLVPKKLKRYYGGEYGLINQIKYNRGRIPQVKSPDLKLRKIFGSDFVYEVDAPPPLLVILWSDNFGALEDWGGANWRWMKNKGQLEVKNLSNKVLRAKLTFKAASFYRQRKLRIVMGDKVLREAIVAPNFPKKFFLKDVVFKPGINKIVFHSKPGPDKIDILLRNFDMRLVTVAFSDLKVEIKE